jgi:hypothetical protein
VLAYFGSSLHRRAAGLASCALCVCLAVAPARAQQGQPSRLAIETVAGVDGTVDESGNDTTGVVLDAVISLDVGHGFEGIVRPFAQRQASGEWNRQIWIATLRYQRAGDLGVRIDAGLIPSPVGLANLMLRPHLNPTISQPSSLYVALPPMQLRGPRLNLLSAVYAYGVHATVSGARWDARAAVIDVSPLRLRRVFTDTPQPRFANVVIGGGVTPVVGVRVGGSVTRGGWQRAGESPVVTRDHDATIVTIESEVSYRYTKLMGEWVRDTLGTDSGDVIVSGWFVQGQQTLTPRWFAAGRLERMSAPALTPFSTFEQQHFTGVEEILGYRLTPEITVRAGHRARRGFGRTGLDHQAEISVIWWRRWK